MAGPILMKFCTLNPTVHPTYFEKCLQKLNGWADFDEILHTESYSAPDFTEILKSTGHPTYFENFL